MFTPNLQMILLFVENPARSARFYEKLFHLKPVEESPTFALFILPNGVQLGLWSPLTADPPAEVSSQGFEIAFPVDDVDKVYHDWLTKGVPMLQPVTDMDFGRTFVAADPDGHRVRVYRLFEELT